MFTKVFLLSFIYKNTLEQKLNEQKERKTFVQKKIASSSFLCFKHFTE